MKEAITYKDAGVSLETADALVDKIRARAAATCGGEVVSGVGGFAALYRLEGGRLLAAGADGVGTKVKIAQGLKKHDTIGIDLVAMCVNDIICTGARPLFFLDYVAMAKIDLDVLDGIVAGIAEGCRQAGMALIGGETAEMPGVYREGEYDLAGFAVGEVMEGAVLDGSRVKAGDTLLALPSSGVHSNGFSLVRKLIAPEETELLEQALVPTRIYVREVKAILPHVSGLAHITGGGLGNIPRMNGLCDYHVDHLPKGAAIFDVLAARSRASDKDLYETFNMGIGLVIATAEPEKLAALVPEAVKIGKVTEGSGRVIVKTDKVEFEI